MKTLFYKRITYIPLSIGIWVLASSFGLVEPSTVLRTRSNYAVQKHDSIDVVVLTKKELIAEKEKGQNIHKTPHENEEQTPNNTVANSLIQWIANGVKVAVEQLVLTLTNLAKFLLITLLKLFSTRLI
jgi:hypothetical protein